MAARRASLPGAAELFRATSSSARPLRDDRTADRESVAPAVPLRPENAVQAGAEAAEDDDLGLSGRPPSRRPAPRRRLRAGDRGATGRERHDEKITVYCSAEELLDLETARLTLRGEHGLAVDRGRIVREAVAIVLAELDAKGASSVLVRRLRER
jgi:hypothetical protein